jgi:hypothetical protein
MNTNRLLISAVAYIPNYSSYNSTLHQLIILLRTLPHGSTFIIHTNSLMLYQICRKHYSNTILSILPDHIPECEGHGTAGNKFKWAFAKIHSLKLLADLFDNNAIVNKHTHVFCVDIDTFFGTGSCIPLNDASILAINYKNQHKYPLSKLIPFLHHRDLLELDRTLLNTSWINSGFLAIPIVSLRHLYSISYHYLDILRYHSTDVLSSIGHYSDELAISLALFSNTLRQSYNIVLISVDRISPLYPVILWSVHMQCKTPIYINAFRMPFHVHIPDIKYDLELLKIFSFFSYYTPTLPLRRLLLSILFNSLVLWNKVIRPYLSGIKRFQIKRIY